MIVLAQNKLLSSKVVIREVETLAEIYLLLDALLLRIQTCYHEEMQYYVYLSLV